MFFISFTRVFSYKNINPLLYAFWEDIYICCSRAPFPFVALAERWHVPTNDL